MNKFLKKIALLTALLLLILPLLSFGPAKASDFSRGNGGEESEGQHIVDRAGLFSFNAKRDLEEEMARLEEKYNIRLFILTVYELEDDALERPYTGIRAFTEDYYDYVVCGGVETNGLILCVNMGAREMWLSTTGEELERFRRDENFLLDEIAERLGDGKYDAAAKRFVKLVEQKHKWGFYLPGADKIILSLGVGVLIGALSTFIMAAGLKNIRQAGGAKTYVVPGSFNLRHVGELFLYSHVTKSEKAQSSSRSGGGFGGGGGSSGFSHGGGGRRF